MVVNFNRTVGQVQVNQDDGIGNQYQVNNVGRGNEEQLVHGLLAADVSQDDVKQLGRALDEDRKDNGGVDPDAPGKRVAQWLSGVGGKVAIGASGGIIAGLVKQYFGMN